MGTTLTGTTPQDTYDSLIKVTDNGPLSGTAKYLSDGLGNDSVLALSTSRVGIGTTSLQAQLHIDGTTAESSFIMERDTVGANAVIGQIKFANNNGTTTYGTLLGGRNAAGDGYSALGTGVGTNLYAVEGGNVGIGTSSPAALLHLEKASQDNVLAVVGQNGFEGTLFLSAAGSGKDANITVGNNRSLIFYSTANSTPAARGTKILTIDSQGIKFGTDTAAANALDDYEEGTFTATIVPSNSGTITLTAGQRTCKYTKIGNKVSITGYLIVSSISSPVGASMYLQGLPFTIASGSSAAGSSNTVFFDAPSYTPSIEPSVFLAGGTQIDIVKNASLIGAGDEFYVSATYFV